MSSNRTEQMALLLREQTLLEQQLRAVEKSLMENGIDLDRLDEVTHLDHDYLVTNSQRHPTQAQWPKSDSNQASSFAPSNALNVLGYNALAQRRDIRAGDSLAFNEKRPESISTPQSRAKEECLLRQHDMGTEFVECLSNSTIGSITREGEKHAIALEELQLLCFWCNADVIIELSCLRQEFSFVRYKHIVQNDIKRAGKRPRLDKSLKDGGQGGIRSVDDVTQTIFLSWWFSGRPHNLQLATTDRPYLSSIMSAELLYWKAVLLGRDVISTLELGTKHLSPDSLVDNDTTKWGEYVFTSKPPTLNQPLLKEILISLSRKNEIRLPNEELKETESIQLPTPIHGYLKLEVNAPDGASEAEAERAISSLDETLKTHFEYWLRKVPFYYSYIVRRGVADNGACVIRVFFLFNRLLKPSHLLKRLALPATWSLNDVVQDVFIKLSFNCYKNNHVLPSFLASMKLNRKLLSSILHELSMKNTPKKHSSTSYRYLAKILQQVPSASLNMDFGGLLYGFFATDKSFFGFNKIFDAAFNAVCSKTCSINKGRSSQKLTWDEGDTRRYTRSNEKVYLQKNGLGLSAQSLTNRNIFDNAPSCAKVEGEAQTHPDHFANFTDLTKYLGEIRTWKLHIGTVSWMTIMQRSNSEVNC